jgi:hypothetical protein
VEVVGSLQRAAGDAHHAVLLALAGQPRAVICDLSDVTGPEDGASLGLLASLGQQVADWPGAPLMLVCPEAALSAGLHRQRFADQLRIHGSLADAQQATDLLPGLPMAHLPLDPALTAGRDARVFVRGLCANWHLEDLVDSASLVATELVTNGVVHTGTMMSLDAATTGSRLRIAVEDGSRQRPHPNGHGSNGSSGRGLALVIALSQSWGVLPTAGGGKVVWAVLEN